MTTSNLPSTSTGPQPTATTDLDLTTTTNSETIVTTFYSTKLTSNSMPQTTTSITLTTAAAVTSNGTNSIVTLPPRITVQIIVAIVTALAFLALAILVVITTITIICLACKCKKKREGVVVVDNSLSLDRNQQLESIYINRDTVVNGVTKGHVADQIDSDGYTCAADQDIPCLTQHFVRPLSDIKEESEAYEQVSSLKTRELKTNNSKLALAQQYAVPISGVGTSTTAQQ